MGNPECLPESVRAALVPHAGLVTRRGLERVGATATDLRLWCRQGLLESVTRAVYAEPVPNAQPEVRYRRFVEAVLLASEGRDVVVTGPAALVLHGLPLIGAPPRVVHAAAPHGHGSRDVDRVRVVGPAAMNERTECGTRTVVTPARAVMDCARVFGVAAAVAAADAALRSGLATERELAESCAQLAGKRGVARARRALRLADSRSESPGESWSAVVIDDLGLVVPERQHEIRDGRGLAGRSDFWWARSRVAGEFDGQVKCGRANPSRRAPEEVLWAEKRREDRMRSTGVTVIRWTAAELTQPAKLLRLLAPHLL